MNNMYIAYKYTPKIYVRSLHPVQNLTTVFNWDRICQLRSLDNFYQHVLRSLIEIKYLGHTKRIFLATRRCLIFSCRSCERCEGQRKGWQRSYSNRMMHEAKKTRKATIYGAAQGSKSKSRSKHNRLVTQFNNTQEIQRQFCFAFAHLIQRNHPLCINLKLSNIRAN